jgi:ribosomal-protein-alanine N-acetyltransferase
MSAVKKPSEVNLMPFALRPLEEGDLPQAVEIERDAFPTLFPPTSFRREMKNRLARYLVAWRRDGLSPRDAFADGAEDADSMDRTPLFQRIFHNARGMLNHRMSAWQPGDQFIAGFVGTWFMVDEAHIVSVGVRSDFRGRGIGELLMLGAIEQAMKQGARSMTLEVRVSNHVARNLYVKYGFTERGIRKGYYTDNREDALIMTTDPIDEPGYIENFQKLVHAHSERWGRSERRF